MLEESVKTKIDMWLSGGYDQETKSHIQSLLDEKEYNELTDAFYKDLEFGTGGLRGIMGVGSNTSILLEWPHKVYLISLRKNTQVKK